MANNVIEYIVRVRDNASGPMEDVGDATQQAGRQAHESTTRYTELNSKIQLAAMGAKAAAAVFKAISGAALGMADAGITAGATMEKFETQLAVLMGSAGEAKGRLDELFEIGSTTPFELSGLMEAETNLRALGVNAEKNLPLIMDFAGAMNVDVAQAAVEVGRAMQFGAGAVETIAGRALRAQVELRTGQNALKMSTEDFRDALTATLTDPDGKFAGGTAKLAATFQGMVSNLQDAWFKFTKTVSESGAFDVAKETLRAMLELIDQNQDGLTIMARVISEGIVKGLLGSVKMAGFLLDAFLAINGAIIDIAKGWTGTVLSIGGVLGKIGLGPTKEEREALEGRLATLTDTKEVLQDMGGFATMAEDMVGRIEDRVASLPKIAARKASQQDEGPKTTAAEDPEAKRKEAEEQQKAFDQMRKDMEKTAREMEGLVQMFEELPAKIAEGFAGALSDPGSALASSLGPSGAILTTLSDLGAKNPKEIAKQFRSFFRNIVRALVKVIPELLATLPEILARNIPFLIEGIIKALPRIVEAFVIKLPIAFAKGLARWFVSALKKIERAFGLDAGRLTERSGRGRRARVGLGGGAAAGAAAGSLLGPVGTAAGAIVGSVIGLLGSKQTGGFVQSTGFQYLHAGERVVPPTGASTSSMMQAAGNIGGGQTINIHTNVVDPNSIRQLGILLNREFGNKGRTQGLSIFNNANPLAGAV